MRKIFACLIVAALPLLGGCIAAVVGGVAASGVLIAEDRRTVGTITEDRGIELKASSRVGEKVPAGHFNYTSFNRMLLLTGEVADAAARDEAERTARAIENVRGVFNELQIGLVSPLSARSSDSYITSSVKARFVNAAQFNPVHVKVVTEAGVVYLMGLVKRAEGDAATEIARTTSNVQKVVRLFEYLE
jgi:osmotically-inducible protein OsmY